MRRPFTANIGVSDENAEKDRAKTVLKRPVAH